MGGRARQPFRGRAARPQDDRNGGRERERQQPRTQDVQPPERDGERPGDDAERDQVEQALPQVHDDDGRHRHASARPVDPGADRDLAEQERRQQQAEAGEVADVGVANRNADVGSPQQKNPPQAAQRRLTTVRAAAAASRSQNAGVSASGPPPSWPQHEHRAEQPDEENGGRRREQQHPGHAPLPATRFSRHDV